MMWIAVSERTREIGLMRAVGATPEQVLRLFLGESVILTLVGGASGMALGLGIAQAIRLAVPAMPVYTPLGYLVAALVVSGAVGLVSGILPARRAAALDPVDALRAE
jgi:putative ABC transport system permease protein